MCSVYRNRHRASHRLGGVGGHPGEQGVPPVQLRGRRDRSPDGQQRQSKVHRFRDLEPDTDAKIRALAQRFDVPLGRVVDAAVARLFAEVTGPDDEAYCATIECIEGPTSKTLRALVEMLAAKSAKQVERFGDREPSTSD